MDMNMRLPPIAPRMTFVPMMLAGSLAIAMRAGPALAQTNYPWCSNFADGFGGTNCGFVSYEQCMATVRGSGGFCNKNDMYRPDSSPPSSTGAAAPHRPHKTASRKST
jgi:Protein of unknown function (DUF3551)